MNRRQLIFAILILATLMPSRALALSDDGGLRSVFSLGAGNRAIGMGGAYTALADDAGAALWNPAGLAALERREISASHTNLFGMGFSEQYLSLALPHWRWGNTSLTLRYFGTDGIEERDDRNVLLGSDLTDSEMEILLAHARTIRPGLSIGGGLKMQQHSLAGYSGGGFGVDAGVMIQPLVLASGIPGPDGDWTIGLAARNLVEPKVRLDVESVPDPRSLSLGSALKRQLSGTLEGIVAISVEKTTNMDTRLHMGLETTYDGMFALRLGSLAGALTTGFGLRWHDVVIDFAYEDHQLGGVKRLGISLLHGLSVSQQRTLHLAEVEKQRSRRLAAAFAATEQQRRNELLAEARKEAEAGQHEQALYLVAMLKALNPDDAEANETERNVLRNLSQYQERQGQPDLAALTLSRLLALSPDDAQALETLQRLRSESAHRNQRTEAIQLLYDEGLDAFAADDLVTARHRFLSALDLDSADKDARAMLIRVDRARQQRLIVMSDEVRSLSRAGLVDEATRVLGRVAESQAPDDTLQALEAVIANARRERDYAQELRRRERARDMEIAALAGTTQAPASPADGDERGQTISPARQVELGRIADRARDQYESGDVDEAIRLWELVWEENPDHAPTRDALRQEYLSRGMEHFSAGRLDEAGVSWEQALRVDPDDPRVRSYLNRSRQQQAHIRRLRDESAQDSTRVKRD